MDTAIKTHTIPASKAAPSNVRRNALQRSPPGENQLASLPSIVQNVLRSPGLPLDMNTRAFLEPRFGHDFSSVQVHTDSQAAESARAVDALAFTVGRNIVFAAGQYAPGTNHGQRLLTHELTHVVQQASSNSTPSHLLSEPDNAAESEAEAESRQRPAAPLFPFVGVTPSALIQRQKAGEASPRLPALKVIPDPGAGKVRVMIGRVGVAEITPTPGQSIVEVEVTPTSGSGQFEIEIRVSRGVDVRVSTELKAAFPNAKVRVSRISLPKPPGREPFFGEEGRARVLSAPEEEPGTAAPPKATKSVPKGPASAPGTEKPAEPPVPKSMAELLLDWNAAGLLNAPLLPPDVSEIPPLEVSEAEAQAAGLPAVPLTKGPTRPPLRLVPTPPTTTTQPLPRVPSPLGAVAAGIAAFLIVFFWSSKTAPPWLDTLNPITGKPYSGKAEYDWERGLSDMQREYLRMLNAARTLSPDPLLENDPAPTQLPTPVPQPARRKKKEEDEDECFAVPVPRRGGHPRHDAYATKVSGSPTDHFVQTPVRKGSKSITYDGLTPPIKAWEVKVGYGWFFSPKHKSLRDKKLAEFDVQKNLGLDVAKICGLSHLWSIPDKWVAALLNARWGGSPPVSSIQEK